MVDAKPIANGRVVFVVHGTWPVKRRPRFANGRAYSPAANKRDDQRVLEAYCEACLTQYGKLVCAPDGVPVTLRVIARRPLPKSIKGDKEPDTVRPDLDNIVKAVADGLNGVAYNDDSQITRISTDKQPREHDAEEYVAVAVSWGDEQSYLR